MLFLTASSSSLEATLKSTQGSLPKVRSPALTPTAHTPADRSEPKYVRTPRIRPRP